MDEAVKDPLFGPVPDQIPLFEAPLVRVLAQVRFSPVFAIANSLAIPNFQEQVSNEYPIASDEQNVALPVGGGAAPKISQIWRFSSGDQKWRISLATDFISLETTSYTSRQDFNERLGSVLKALGSTFKPSRVRRIGVRYVDHIKGEPLLKLSRLVRPELVGFSTSELHPNLIRSLNETLCNTQEGKLLIRWGLMSENTTHDPVMLPAIPDKSWMLDLDAYTEFREAQPQFDETEIQEMALTLAARVYAFFRWAIKKEFITTYGGRT